VTLSIEFNIALLAYTDPYFHRSLLTQSTAYTLLSFGGFLCLIQLASLTFIAYKAVNTFNTTKPSKLVTFVKGLNLKKQWYSALYFFHYLGL